MSDGGSEEARIARLASVFGAASLASTSGVTTGIGDDAAVLASGDPRALVWTIDAQVEGVHFRRDLVSFGDLGWRAFMAAASDLAAMGAEPWCALSALVLPKTFAEDAFDAMALGQRRAADVVGAPIVGGNLARGDVVSITITLLGRCARAIERRGALPGDGLWISGPVGLAAAGLRALEQNMQNARTEPAIAAFRLPHARIKEGLAMAKVAHAAIDVSDGLAHDVAQLASASGCRIVIDEGALLAHTGAPLEQAALALGANPRDLALYGGEDYAVVAASSVPIEGFSRIGEVRIGDGVALTTSRGEEELSPRGFDHFS